MNTTRIIQTTKRDYKDLPYHILRETDSS
jgi:hypothetical protein